MPTDIGSPQGATVSPLLANICLHYALDLWVQQWRRRHAHGDIIIVRYADDFLSASNIIPMRSGSWMICAKDSRGSGWNCIPRKLGLFAFGRFAKERRQRRGISGAPPTFNFLGFTHCCGRSREREVYVGASYDAFPADGVKFGRSLSKCEDVCINPLLSKGNGCVPSCADITRITACRPTSRRSACIPEGGYAMAWYKSLRRRSQRRRLNWTRMDRLAAAVASRARIVHPWPHQRFAARVNAGRKRGISGGPKLRTFLTS